VPFALAVAAADLAPGDAVAPPPAQISLAGQPPSNAVMGRHIPDEPLPPPSKDRCLDARDCRIPVPPAPDPPPAGKR
jgi:hypothetical protein